MAAVTYVVNDEDREIDQETTTGELLEAVSQSSDDHTLVHYDPRDTANVYGVKRSSKICEQVPPEHELATVSRLVESRFVEERDVDRRPGPPAWVMIDDELVRIGWGTTPRELQERLNVGGNVELVWHDENGEVGGVCRDTVYENVPQEVSEM